MLNAELERFDLELGRAAMEARDPSMAHWAAGFASCVEHRVCALLGSGRLASFNQVSVGIGARRQTPQEDALFRDGTGLVLLRQGEPWEACELAQRCLSEYGEAWICARLTLRVPMPGFFARWACAKVLESEKGSFEDFWERMSMELARAEVRVVSEISGYGHLNERACEIERLREQALTLLEAKLIDEAIPSQSEKKDDPLRL